MTVQLRERHWRIFSLSGTLETVRGRGVVGQVCGFHAFTVYLYTIYNITGISLFRSRFSRNRFPPFNTAVTLAYRRPVVTCGQSLDLRINYEIKLILKHLLQIRGTFKMEKEDGNTFDCRIPPFTLESKPDASSPSPNANT